MADLSQGSMTADVRTKLADYLTALADRLNTPSDGETTNEDTATKVAAEMYQTADELRSHNLVPGATTITSYDGGETEEGSTTEGLTLRSTSGEPS